MSLNDALNHLSRRAEKKKAQIKVREAQIKSKINPKLNDGPPKV